MNIREETITVGGVDVHTWIGGQGDPLLVLHGAGGNRGFTRSMRALAERHTVWAPTHPGFGASGDAEWMDGIDDLARFHLWFMDAAGLRRPHVLGHSIGGWTAAEMAAMSPGSIDRLVLVAPVGLKPETGEILDVFFYSPPQLRDLTVHDPKTIPEWEELFGRAPTPAELLDLLVDIGEAVPSILDAVNRAGAGLLVMGAFGEGRVQEAIFGSTTGEILEEAPCPVLLAS